MRSLLPEERIVADSAGIVMLSGLPPSPQQGDLLDARLLESGAPNPQPRQVTTTGKIPAPIVAAVRGDIVLAGADFIAEDRGHAAAAYIESHTVQVLIALRGAQGGVSVVHRVTGVGEQPP
jgi:hypothetical protein